MFRGFDFHFTDVLEGPGVEGGAQGDEDGDGKGAGWFAVFVLFVLLPDAFEFDCVSELIYDLVKNFQGAAEGDFFFFAAVHFEDLIGVVADVEGVGRGDAVVRQLLGDHHAVNAEDGDFLPFVRPADQVIPVVVPDGGVGGYDIFFFRGSLVFRDLFLVRVVLQVAETDLLVPVNGFPDLLDGIDHVLVLGFDMLGDQDLGPEFRFMGRAGHPGELSDQFLASALRDELGCGNSIDENLQFRLGPVPAKIRIRGVFSVLFPDGNFISAVFQGTDVAPQGANGTFVSLLFEGFTKVCGGQPGFVVRLLLQGL